MTLVMATGPHHIPLHRGEENLLGPAAGRQDGKGHVVQGLVALLVNHGQHALNMKLAVHGRPHGQLLVALVINREVDRVVKQMVEDGGVGLVARLDHIRQLRGQPGTGLVRHSPPGDGEVNDLQLLAAGDVVGNPTGVAPTHDDQSGIPVEEVVVAVLLLFHLRGYARVPNGGSELNC